VQAITQLSTTVLAALELTLELPPRAESVVASTPRAVAEVTLELPHRAQAPTSPVPTVLAATVRMPALPSHVSPAARVIT